MKTENIIFLINRRSDRRSTYWRIDEIFLGRHSGVAVAHHMVDVMNRLKARIAGNSRVAELNSVDLLSSQSGSEVWIPKLGVSKSNRSHCLRRAKEPFGCRVDESCSK